MAAARSSLETEVVSIMRSLRERGQLERKALARRLKAAPGEALGVMPGRGRNGSEGGEGNRPVQVPGSVSAGR